jgi:hypothetical protein
MSNFKYLLAAAALGSFVGFPQTGAAAPLAGNLAAGVPTIADELVQKVHGWHCRKRKGWYHGHRVWHRHRRACYDDSYYDDDYYDDYSYGYGYPYGYGAPFFSFYFDDDDHRGRRHYRYRKRKKHYDDDD